MADSSINKSITVASEPEEQMVHNSSFPDAVKELGKTLFERYPNTNSNISRKNEKGLLQIDVLNEYMIKNFGYRFTSLDKLRDVKLQRTLSVNGFGIETFIKSLQGIQTQFQQAELTNGLNRLIRR